MLCRADRELPATCIHPTANKPRQTSKHEHEHSDRFIGRHPDGGVDFRDPCECSNKLHRASTSPSSPGPLPTVWCRAPHISLAQVRTRSRSKGYTQGAQPRIQQLTSHHCSLSQFLNRKPLRKRPTAHLPYDEGLHLIKAFLEFASKHTVEELQAFTAQWVPHPQWVKVEEINIPEPQSLRAASLIEEQLGPEGIRAVGGTKWWQWRKPNSPLRAEWIEMRSDYRRRKGDTQPCKRIMLYVHGGAYFFGSVDEHRYQIQRHARKLKARVIAPRYRLAPQFPFPCGIQDCLATYLYLLEAGHTPNTIILAGDSAGGGMVLSVLVTLRDRGIAMPAGAVLISPWVDLTHSFPSVAIPADLDYVPQYGFHHKPSESWPPPNTEDVRKMKAARAGSSGESEKGGSIF